MSEPSLLVKPTAEITSVFNTITGDAQAYVTDSSRRMGEVVHTVDYPRRNDHHFSNDMGY